MNQYVTGAVIRELREKKGMTQADLAQRLFVSDKTVSKWENGKGYPDISLLDPIAKLFGVSIAELVSGEVVRNINVCGNVIHTMGEAAISCHGVQLTPAQPEETDENHMIFVEGVEDEYYVRIEHDMTKTHYISFVAALSPDRLQLVKLYPEGNAEARFQVRGVKQLFFYCNRDGLFRLNVKPSIDARRASYDDTAHRRALEQTAASIFG